MIYRVFKPIAPLADVVAYFWYVKVELTAPLVQHYATPLLEGLAFNFNMLSEEHSYNQRTITLDKNAYFFGQPCSSRLITTNRKGIDVLGVKFMPLGLAKILGIKMEYLADSIVAAEDLLGAELAPLCDAMQSASHLNKALTILQGFLLKKLANRRMPSRMWAVHNALLLINSHKGSIGITDLQLQTNTTRKTLERAFNEYIGLSPKFYSRIVRFNIVRAALEAATGTRPKYSAQMRAADYYDASHFIAEFKYFSGTTPTEYYKNKPLKLVLKHI